MGEFYEVATMRNCLLLCAIAVAPLPVNCLMAQDAAPSEKPKPEDVFEARIYRRDGGGALIYRLLRPADDRPQQKYPLVLFLHGAGERGDDNVLQLVHGGRNFADEAMRRRHPAFIMAPQCPAEKKWVEVPWDAPSHTMPAEPSETMQLVFDAVDALVKEFSIDEKRIYGVGLSMGGYGVWDILQRRPKFLAAAIPICAGGDPAYAPGFKHAPVWAFHGDKDGVVGVHRSREMVAALRAAGGNPLYTEYEGVEHDSWTMTFDNRLLWDWLFAQRRTE
jgi:predicted peptidase